MFVVWGSVDVGGRGNLLSTERWFFLVCVALKEVRPITKDLYNGCMGRRWHTSTIPTLKVSFFHQVKTEKQYLNWVKM